MNNTKEFLEISSKLLDIQTQREENGKNGRASAEFLDTHGDKMETPAYGSSLLKHFDECRQEGLLCDLKLKVHDRVFQVHRLLLAGCSDYFRAMFSHDMLEKTANTLELSAVSARAMDILLDYVYSGQLGLTLSNLPEVLAGASFLQMTSALELCSKFMKNNLAFDNADLLVKLAEMFGISELADDRLKYILEHFDEFCASSEFLETEASVLAQYLQSDDLRTPHEAALLMHVIRWYKHKPQERSSQVFLLCDRVRYVLDGWPTIEYAAKQELFKNNDQLKLLMDWCHEYMHMASRRYLYSDHRTRVRCSEKTLVVLAGGAMTEDLFEYQVGRCRYQNYYWNKEHQQWGRLGINAHTEKRSAAPLIEINNYALMFGGFTHADEMPSSMFSREVKYLSGQDFAIWDLPSMLVERAHHVAAHIPGYVFIVGGHNDSGALASVERLNMDKEKWRFVCSLDKPLVYHAGAAYKHKVYISGGIEEGVVTSRVQCYRPAKDKWENKSPMLSARYAHTMTSVGSELIVCGGKASRDHSRCLSSVEAYNIDTDQWTFLAPMRLGCAHMTAAVLDDSLLILGGQNSVCDRMDEIQSYSRSDNSWGLWGSLKFPACDILCCAISVKPKIETKHNLYGQLGIDDGYGDDEEMLYDDLYEDYEADDSDYS